MRHSTVAFASLLLLLASAAACSGGDGATGGAGGDGGGGGDGGAGGDATTSTGTGPTAEDYVTLRIDDGPPPPIVLDLDKQKAMELFGEDAARQIKLLDVDTTDLLINALTEIENACGTSWQNDSPNPMHNCALTALGQSFGASWQTSAEFAMVRLLTMTPANAVLTGTSLEDVANLFNENPDLFAYDFAEVLRESLGLPPGTGRTMPFIPMGNLVTALQQQLLGTHPAIMNSQGTMPITMYDALLDLTPLATKLGPIGASPWDDPDEHPGVLTPDDATFTTRSDALLPTFRMRVTAESNLRWVSGVDLSAGGGDMYLREGSAALQFDFNDPQKLQITGVADNPTMDMRIKIHEVPGTVPSCTEVPACKSNYPPPMGTPVGTGTIWTQPSPLLEPIVARAGLSTYGERTFYKCYLTFNATCQTSVSIGQNGDPLGWTLFFVDISFGGEEVSTPPPQFLWELLTEVAQVAVHDPTGDGVTDIPEGQAQPTFALHGVSIGLTGDELIAQIRPTLQSQADQISDLILGRYWKNNDALDFYYRRGEPDGAPYLFFVDESDERPDPDHPDTPRPYTYDKPGFFTSPDLSEASKVSAELIDGIDDTTHEKYRLPAGDTTLYMQDDAHDVYEVRFFVPEGADPVEIVAKVKRL